MKYTSIIFLVALALICSSCQPSHATSTPTPTVEPTPMPTCTPHNIVIMPTPSPTSPISAVSLKILQNDAEALTFGFNFLDTAGQEANFSGYRSAKFFGQIWQGHSDSPVSYIVQLNIHINTSEDTVTIPYSIMDFSGIDESKPINIDFAIEGLVFKFDRYSFWLSIPFTKTPLQLPATVEGNRSD